MWRLPAAPLDPLTTSPQLANHPQRASQPPSLPSPSLLTLSRTPPTPAQPVLKRALPQLAPLMHDPSPKVREAMAELLLVISACRELHFYDVVPVEALLEVSGARALRGRACAWCGCGCGCVGVHGGR